MSHTRTARICLSLAAVLAVCSARAADKPAAPAPAAATDANDPLMSIRLFNGLEYDGIVQKTSSDRDLVLLTIYGTLEFPRSDIVRSRKEFSDAEQARIRTELRDADAYRRLAGERAERAAAAYRAEIGPTRVRGGAEPAGQALASRPEPIRAPQLSGNYGWEERMERQLNRKVTIELTGESLADAMNLLSSITGLTIIINPKVQVANPTVTLRVTDMDAASALRWITKLTDTYAELKDQAIWITDKPSKEADDQEKQDIIIMAATVGAQIDLPADGTPLTDDDRVRIARQIAEKEMPKITDFPGPDLGLGPAEHNANPFGAAP